MRQRPEKDQYYLRIAREVAARGTCLRRNHGAVIVNRDQIISTGYAGAARGAPNCIEGDECPRERANVPRGERYELCRSVHAEMNAIIHAARSDMVGGTLYLVGITPEGEVVEGTEPCLMCRRVIINAGIKDVVVMRPDGSAQRFAVERWINEESPPYLRAEGRRSG